VTPHDCLGELGRLAPWLSRVRVEANGCWAWTGTLVRGRGILRFGKRSAYSAYRLLYQLRNGPIPAGLVIDHLCFNPACVNPAHLEAVAPGENSRREVQRRRTMPLMGNTEELRSRRRQPRPKTPRPSTDWKHGTSGCYTNHGCRCELCRIAWREYHRCNGYQQRYRSRVRALPTPEEKHGTRTGYENYGCRCDRCKEASRTAGREYRTRKVG
jgi:hypothetical protein